MNSAVCGAVVGGMLGVVLGWAPALIAAGLCFAMSNGVVTFLPAFFGVWAWAAVVAALGAAGVAYVLGRFGDE